MLAAVVALIVQGAWQVAHRLLIENGLGRDRYVNSFTFAIDVASYATIALAAFDVSRRLERARKVGTRIVAWTTLAMVAVLLAGIATAYVAPRDAIADSAAEIIDDVWLGVEILAIVGFAIASGRRGAWLGALAIGFVLLRRHPDDFIGGLGLRVAFSALAIGVRVLLAVMALEIGRIASPPKPDADRAVRALRLLELVAWVDVAFDLVDIVMHAANVAQLYRSLVSVAVGVLAGAFAIYACWSLVRAAVPRMPRWPWAFATMCSIVALARTVATWSGILVRWWGRLDEIPLVPSHWIVMAPAYLALAGGIGSLAVLARRTGSRELSRAATAALVSLAVGLGGLVAIGSTTIVVLAIYAVEATTTAIAYRYAQPVVRQTAKLTDVFS